MSDFDLDLLRAERVGLEEALFCGGKTTEQIARIVETMASAGRPMFLTRLEESRFSALDVEVRSLMDYDARSSTAMLGPRRPSREVARVAVVSAGTSDLPVSREAARTLQYYGEAVSEFNDVGVAGLHRLISRLADIRAHEVVIAVAGMVFGWMVWVILEKVIKMLFKVWVRAMNDYSLALNYFLPRYLALIICRNFFNCSFHFILLFVFLFLITPKQLK